MNEFITPPNLEDLKALFKENNVPFELIKHDTPIHSAQDGARYFGINVGQTAPTLILKTDKGFFALIMSGDRGHVNFDEVAGILGCKKVKLAGAREVKKLTGCTVGSISMVGHNLPCILDSRTIITRSEKSLISLGLWSSVIFPRYNFLITWKLEKPIKHAASRDHVIILAGMQAIRVCQRHIPTC